MIKLTYSIMETDLPYGEGPHEQVFGDTELMRQWLRDQHGHPFLYTKIAKVEELIDGDWVLMERW